jgi:hypothetical protein
MRPEHPGGHNGPDWKHDGQKQEYADNREIADQDMTPPEKLLDKFIPVSIKFPFDANRQYSFPLTGRKLRP